LLKGKFIELNSINELNYFPKLKFRKRRFCGHVHIQRFTRQNIQSESATEIG